MGETNEDLRKKLAAVEAKLAQETKARQTAELKLAEETKARQTAELKLAEEAKARKMAEENHGNRIHEVQPNPDRISPSKDHFMFLHPFRFLIKKLAFYFKHSRHKYRRR